MEEENTLQMLKNKIASQDVLISEMNKDIQNIKFENMMIYKDMQETNQVITRIAKRLPEKNIGIIKHIIKHVLSRNSEPRSKDRSRTSDLSHPPVKKNRKNYIQPKKLQ